MQPICTIAVMDAVMVDAVPAQGNSGLPVSVSREAMYNRTPVKHVGKMIIIPQGRVPSKTWGREIPIIPQSTDVGQSKRR